MHVIIQFTDWQGQGFFFFHHHVQTASVANPTSYPMGSGVSSPRAKQLACEADHSTTSTAKVKNVQSYTSIPPYNFTA